MAGAGSPFIKPEPNDFFDLNHTMQYNHQNGQQNFNPANGNINVNPASLSNGNNPMSQSFSQNMSSSFNMGNAGIADDELLDLQIDQGNNHNPSFDFNSGMQNFMHNNVPVDHQQAHAAAAFSHTPDGAPMQSPFTHEFNYSHFRAMPNQQQFAGPHSLPHQAGFRPHVQNMDRKISDARSSATPNTPAMNLPAGDNFHSGMQQIMHRRQQASLGGNDWDSTPSGHSWNESSPFPSPVNGHPMQRQISEVLTQNPQHHHKVASSLPTKMEPGTGPPPFQSQEAKRRRRRESHNMVERRRRDNINERIHDLGFLVPQHRLEDEKVRKHLQTNAPLSPSISATTGMSPPNPAASLLSGPQGRRATAGNITQGLPLEDKDKGPNKGDILNSSVAWTRDLMWYTSMKLREEEQLKDYIRQLGGAWPFEQDEDEKRMHSEISEVLGRHTATAAVNGYTRAPGSGLRVPGFTNVAGDSVGSDGQANSSGQGVSPGFQSGGSSGGISHQASNNFNWNDNFTAELKEEDEYGMEV